MGFVISNWRLSLLILGVTYPGVAKIVFASLDVVASVVDGGDVNQFVPISSLEKLERPFKNVGAGFSSFDDPVDTALELPLSGSVRFCLDL